MRIRSSTIGEVTYNERHFIYCSNTVLNIISASLTVLGQVGQNVGLPIWIASVPNGGSLDSYFILLYTCVWFFIVFVFGSLYQWIFGYFTCNELCQFINIRSCLETCLVGSVTALNGLFLVFAADPNRTPAFLQSALTNIMIPLVIIIRFIVLRKVPTKIQLLAAFGVIVGLFITAVPSIFDFDPSESQKSQASGVWVFLWPLIFMLSFIPAALYTVLEELFLSKEINDQKRNKKSFPGYDEYNDDDEDLGSSIDEDNNDGLYKIKETVVQSGDKQIPISLFLSMVTFFQTITFVFLFWYDLLPTIGYASTIHEFFDNFYQDLKYTFVMDGAKIGCFIGFILFVSFYCMNSYGVSLLMRYSNGMMNIF